MHLLIICWLCALGALILIVIIILTVSQLLELLFKAAQDLVQILGPICSHVGLDLIIYTADQIKAVLHGLCYLSA